VVALLVVVLAAAVAGCGGGDDDDGPATLAVYVSAPLHGGRAGEGRAIVAGAKLALQEAGARVGDFRIRAVYLDDTGGGPKWSPVATAANARRAAEDSSTIGYIGDVDSGATRFSLPITNQADIVQISPASTAVDLTREAGGVDPDVYRPSDEQTFARVVPANDVQARAAGLLKRQGTAERAAISPDGSFDFTPCPPPGGVVISPFRDPSRLVDPPADGERELAAPGAAYGYEAMALLLDAIRRAGASGEDRGPVTDQVLSTSDRRSIIGEYSIDGNGDTTLDLITVYRIDRDCRLNFDRELRAP
jgi:ABC-type branched-subunit amino acid transport system substrate-binding protein